MDVESIGTGGQREREATGRIGTRLGDDRRVGFARHDEARTRVVDATGDALRVGQIRIGERCHVGAIRYADLALEDQGLAGRDVAPQHGQHREQAESIATAPERRGEGGEARKGLRRQRGHGQCRRRARLRCGARRAWHAAHRRCPARSNRAPTGCACRRPGSRAPSRARAVVDGGMREAVRRDRDRAGVEREGPQRVLGLERDVADREEARARFAAGTAVVDAQPRRVAGVERVDRRDFAAGVVTARFDARFAVHHRRRDALGANGAAAARDSPAAARRRAGRRCGRSGRGRRGRRRRPRGRSRARDPRRPRRAFRSRARSRRSPPSRRRRPARAREVGCIETGRDERCVRCWPWSRAGRPTSNGRTRTSRIVLRPESGAQRSASPPLECAAGGRSMASRPSVRRVCLAYSGGLDTSVILKWLIEHYRCEVVAYCARRRSGRGALGASRQGQGHRRLGLRGRRRARGVRARLRVSRDPGLRRLRRHVPARYLARAAADREAPGR